MQRRDILKKGYRFGGRRGQSGSKGADQGCGRLRAAGHLMFTPTQTGLGERKHLLSKDITLDTFTKDIVNVI